MVRCVHCGGPCDEVLCVRRFMRRDVERLPVCEGHVSTVRRNIEQYGGEVFGLSDAVF